MATAFKPRTAVGRWAVLFGGILLAEMLVTAAVGMVYAPAPGMANFLVAHVNAWGTTAAIALVLGVIGLLHYAERSVSNVVAVLLGFVVVAGVLLPPTYY